jgi:hypothetical protein
MTADIADKLMAFLNEMTEDGGEDEEPEVAPPTPPAAA